MNRGKLIHYMTSPERETEIEIDINKITVLRNLLKDFDYSMINYQHDFIYKNLEIIITQKGTILISLVTYSDFADNISLLSKFINKINSIISINHFSEGICSNDLKDVSYLKDLTNSIKNESDMFGVCQ